MMTARIDAELRDATLGLLAADLQRRGLTTGPDAYPPAAAQLAYGILHTLPPARRRLPTSRECKQGINAWLSAAGMPVRLTRGDIESACHWLAARDLLPRGVQWPPAATPSTRAHRGKATQ